MSLVFLKRLRRSMTFCWVLYFWRGSICPGTLNLNYRKLLDVCGQLFLIYKECKLHPQRKQRRSQSRSSNSRTTEARLKALFLTVKSTCQAVFHLK